MRILQKIIDIKNGAKKCGKVVSKEDWDRIRRVDKKLYDFINDERNIGHCYYMSWVLALLIEDASIMYCSANSVEGIRTGHATVIKNGYVYDTNLQRHFELKEYLEMYEVEIYKVFTKREYQSKDFFDSIRKDFIAWCQEQGAYCDPQ